MQNSEESLPYPLNEGRCAICDNDYVDVRQSSEATDDFRYICKSCNPKLIIALADGLLFADDYDEFRENISLRKIIEKDIKTSKEKIFRISPHVIKKYSSN